MNIIFELPKDRPWVSAQSKTAAQQLVSAIDATGGLVAFEGGRFAPEGDDDWIDLGEAYLAACNELGVPALVGSYETEEGVRWPAAHADPHGEMIADAAEWAGMHHKVGDREFKSEQNYWFLRYLLATTPPRKGASPEI